MSFLYGRCRNPLTCSLADSGIVLRLTEAEGFFCPECARPLTPAPAWGGGPQWRRVLLAGAVLVLGGAGAAALLLPRHSTVPPLRGTPVLRPASQALVHQPAVLQNAVPERVTPITAPASSLPLHMSLGASAVAGAPPPHMLTAPTWPAIPKPGRAEQNAKPKPPKSLTPLPIPAPSPEETAQVAPPPPIEPLAPLPQQQPPAPAAPQEPHSTGPRVIVLPPGSSLSFGPLKGVNLPSLPAHMMFVNPEQARKPGSIQVDCKIGLDGVPSDCRKIAEKGGADVSDTILAWLGSGAIRYTPAMKDGHKVVERRVLTVNFGGVPKP